MNLKDYFGKEVNILASNGSLFCGFVSDYLFPEDNDQHLESIILETYSGDLVGFLKKDIVSISIVNGNKY